MARNVLGNSTERKDLQPEKASLPIAATRLVMVEFLQPTIRIWEDDLMIALQYSRLSKVGLALSTEIDSMA
jgi:hypothetical protein